MMRVTDIRPCFADRLFCLGYLSERGTTTSLSGLRDTLPPGFAPCVLVALSGAKGA
jgi:hypothetical protein